MSYEQAECFCAYEPSPAMCPRHGWGNRLGALNDSEMTMRTRRITVSFTDFVDDGTSGLGDPADYRAWLINQMEGVRNIRIENIEIEEDK